MLIGCERSPSCPRNTGKIRSAYGSQYMIPVLCCCFGGWQSRETELFVRLSKSLSSHAIQRRIETTHWQHLIPTAPQSSYPLSIPFLLLVGDEQVSVWGCVLPETQRAPLFMNHDALGNCPWSLPVASRCKSLPSSRIPYPVPLCCRLIAHRP